MYRFQSSPILEGGRVLHGKLVSPREVDDFITLRMRAFTSKSRQLVTQKVLAAEDLPMLEWQVMFSVARFGTCHLAYITRNTSIDPAHGSRAATSLEKKGLVSRVDDPNNRRRKLISLTSKGRTLFEKIWPRTQSLIGVVERSLAPQEFQELKRLLDKSNKALENMMLDTQTEEKDVAQQPSQMQRKIA